MQRREDHRTGLSCGIILEGARQNAAPSHTGADPESPVGDDYSRHERVQAENHEDSVPDVDRVRGFDVLQQANQEGRLQDQKQVGAVATHLLPAARTAYTTRPRAQHTANVRIISVQGSHPLDGPFGTRSPHPGVSRARPAGRASGGRRKRRENAWNQTGSGTESALDWPSRRDRPAANVAAVVSMPVVARSSPGSWSASRN